MSATRLAPRSVRGTTLLELLVVVGIMAVMVGMMQVTTAQGGSIALDQATVKLQDACVRAQGLARSGRAPVGVVFDVAGNRFAVVREDGTAARDPLTRADMILSLAPTNTQERVTLTAADFGDAGTAALFDAQGVPVCGGTVTLSRDGATRTLTLDAATGDLLGP